MKMPFTQGICYGISLYASKTGVNPNRFSPVVLTVAEKDIRGGKCLKRPNNEW